MSDLPAGIYFALLPQEYIDDAYELEVQGYPADEAASLESLRYRQAHAPALFLGAFLAPSPQSKPVLLAFACGTLTSSSLVTHASMSSHDPSGTTVALHSLCVSPTHRRLGIGRALLEEYAKRAREGAMGGVQRIALLSRASLRELYKQVGFKEIGESEVQHGQEKWYDMVLDLNPAEEDVQAPAEAAAVPGGADLQSIPGAAVPASGGTEPDPPTMDGPTQAQVIAALLAERTRPPAPDSRTAATIPAGELTDARGRNVQRLRCLRPGCGSLILLEGVGELREGGEESLFDLDADRPAPHPLFPPITPSQKWWLVTPSPMAFENVAFSRAVPPAAGDSGGRARKYLGCAECELGPVGWCWEGATTEYWVSVDRVGYRT
ncbi:acyl-CoA N-acyltransferase [Calocera cornea HHB12733]|uniref:Acyl-CoA N-acyltransferase n=1 Tax=Calocera cornea HHB12733 TaxID=1353952 RepID=A0A165E7L6_9BASI|nr:acyl-CoA N-acyltransferase [Calocera cornea HHB12733]